MDFRTSLQIWKKYVAVSKDLEFMQLRWDIFIFGLDMSNDLEVSFCCTIFWTVTHTHTCDKAANSKRLTSQTSLSMSGELPLNKRMPMFTTSLRQFWSAEDYMMKAIFLQKNFL